DLAETGIVHHSVYLSAGEVVFVFEGHQVEWMVDDLVNDPFRPKLQSAFDAWRSIVDGHRASPANGSAGKHERQCRPLPRRWLLSKADTEKRGRSAQARVGTGRRLRRRTGPGRAA